MIKNPKAVIFDLDGTIVYSIPDLRRAMNKMRESWHLPPIDDEKMKHCINYGGRVMVARALDNPDDDAFIEESLSRFKAYYRAETVVETTPYDGITDLISSLREKGIKTAVITNKDADFIPEIESKLFPGLFDIMMGFSGEFPHKPHPESTEYILKTLGVSKKDAMFVGDSAVDMKTAKNVGLDAVWVSWGYAGRDSLDAYPNALEVDSPEELKKLILN